MASVFALSLFQCLPQVLEFLGVFWQRVLSSFTSGTQSSRGTSWVQGLPAFSSGGTAGKEDASARGPLPWKGGCVSSSDLPCIPIPWQADWPQAQAWVQFGLSLWTVNLLPLKPQLQEEVVATSLRQVGLQDPKCWGSTNARLSQLKNESRTSVPELRSE